MKLPLVLVALVALAATGVASGMGAQAEHEQASARAALVTALQHAADGAVTQGRDFDYDDAVRVGPALVPVRVAVRTARGGAADGHVHSSVRATGPGGVPVVASATLAP